MTMTTIQGTPSAGEVTGHLRLDGLVAGYGSGPPVIQGVCLGVARGQIAVVAGPNGAGKSTLVKAIMGQLKVREGAVRLGDREITNHPAEQIARHGIGYVPQHRDVFDTLTVLENLEIGGYLLSKRLFQERVAKVYERFPLLFERRSQSAGRLSGGERKMLAIGRTLLTEPTLLVLDEPTAGLSPEMSRIVLGTHVRNLAADGTAVLLIEQKASEALAISAWAYCLVDGQVRVSAEAAEVAHRPDIGEILLGRKELDGVV